MSKSREKLYLSHFLVFLFWLLGKQRKELPFFLGTAGRKSDMISNDRIGKTRAWLKEGRRGEREMTAPLILWLLLIYGYSCGLSSEL